MKSALKELGRAQTQLDKAKEREHRVRERLEATTAKLREAPSAAAIRTERQQRQQLRAAMDKRRQAAAKYREAAKLVREQQQVARETERKERAKAKAVAAFVKRWEREYDRDMTRKKKNIKLRKRMVRND